MSELHLPWMEISILCPLIGALLVASIADRSLARTVCVFVGGLTFAFAVGEWIDFAILETFEAHDHWDVVEFMFHKDIFVIDELSAPLLPLTALLCLLTAVSTVRTKASRFSFARLLVSESILIATLSCRDAWTIITLLIAATLPVWLELRSRGRCPRVFVFHMALFAALLIAGQTCVELDLLLVGGACLTLAALLRTGIVPLHCWVTDLFDKATFGTSLMFVIPMTGAYAVMRLVLPIAPDWAMQSIAVVSLVTAVYAGSMALVQTEARRFFCYLFLSHSSLVLVGLELATPIGLTGALCVWLSVGLSLGGFGLTLRSVESRIGRISFSQFHGLYEKMPTLGSIFLLTGLASIGFPGTIGFIGTELLIEGAVDVYPLIGMTVVLATALNGIAVLYAYFRIFTGCRHSGTFCLSARPGEKWAVILIAVLIIGGGLYPQWGVASRYHAATELILHRNATLSPEQRSADSFSGKEKSLITTRTPNRSHSELTEANYGH